MGSELRFARSFGRRECPMPGFLVITGCFVIPLMYFMFYNLQMDPSITASRIGETRKFEPICDVSNERTDVCEMVGDIRIHGLSSLVIYTTRSDNDLWKIKPYARKFDVIVLPRVREVTVRSYNAHEELSSCSMKHQVPGIVFSTQGYTGNFFHDLTDVIMPLFLTSRQYNGEVQFLVSNLMPWWIKKYKLIFDGLTNYEIIDFDNDNRTHCFQHAIVGLRSHGEFRIIPSKSQKGYSSADFTKFLRSRYSLERNLPVRINDTMKKKPRLLIISRKKSRRIINLEEIVSLARWLGFVMVIAEAGEGGLANFARIVNSCDVMMGVHGAGLTNMIFLPKNSVVIQVVPWGGLEWWMKTYFGEPAVAMELSYLEYNIKEEETSLIEIYPKNHTVFTNPSSITKKGWRALRDAFLVKQDVTLDVNRFKGVLVKALNILHEV